MIGMVLVTHGGLATEFRSALEHVVGPQKQLATITIGPEDDMEQRRSDILQAVHSVDSGDGVVLLTDMFGGTPTNLACTFLGNAPIEVVTGVNLPMILRLAEQQPDEALAVIARRVRDQGQKTIYLASEVLAPTKQPPGQTNGKE